MARRERGAASRGRNRARGVLFGTLSLGLLLALVSCEPSGESTPAKPTSSPPPATLEPDLDPSHRDELGEPLADSRAAVYRETTDPEVARALFSVAEGYRLHLFASEKAAPIASPIAIDWDDAGRLWVLTRPGLPEPSRAVDSSPIPCRLVILEDTDGDHSADAHRAFDLTLEEPTSLLTASGGALVSVRGGVVRISLPAEGEDRIEPVQILALGDEATLRQPRTLARGEGGWILLAEEDYLHVSLSESDVETGTRGGHVWRFRLPVDETSKIEPELVSPHGLNVPVDLALVRPGQTVAADRTVESILPLLPLMPGAVDAALLETPPDLKRLPFQIITSLLGPSSARKEDPLRDQLLVSTAVGVRGVRRYRLSPAPDPPALEELEPLLVSRDPCFRPVDLSWSPDGVLAVADHWSPLFRPRLYAADDPRRDHGHGRIWLLEPPGRETLAESRPTSAELSLEELLAGLESPVFRQRHRAFELLLERKADDVLELLLPRLDPEKSQAPRTPEATIQRLALAGALGEDLVPHLRRELSAESPLVRAWAVETLGRELEDPEKALEDLGDSIEDSSARVRLAAVVALSRFANLETLDRMLQVLFEDSDSFIERALRAALRQHESLWLPAMQRGEDFGVGNPDGVELALEDVPTEEVLRVAPTVGVYRALLGRAGVPDAARRDCLNGLAFLAGNTGLDQLIELLESIDDEHHPALEELCLLLVKWDAEELAARLDLWEELARRGKTEGLRAAATALWVEVDASSTRVFEASVRDASRLLDFLVGFRWIRDARIRQEHANDLAAIATDRFEPATERGYALTDRHRQLALGGLALLEAEGEVARLQVTSGLATLEHEGLREAAIGLLLGASVEAWEEGEAGKVVKILEAMPESEKDSPARKQRAALLERLRSS